MKVKDFVSTLKANFSKKNFIASTVKMAAKIASLYINGVRYMFNIVSVCRL